MNVLIITASPNVEGLTAACSNAAKAGAEAAGANVVTTNLNKLHIGNCQACGNGWGTCRNEHKCQVQDDFQELHASLSGFDAFVMITPVYWGDLSESAKAFTDRARRCEALKQDKTVFEAKPFMAIAAAGGSGNGLVSCLATMERFLTHVKADKFDLLGITQKSRGYKLDTLYAASKAMISYA
ncbi:MAG: flavodoxin family protein [Peptococcaceae bacterium]|nr:flavodoxin family protein [Peptococcaceae bacterium]